MGNPIQCSEKISFAVSDWTNDFSHTWKTSFALLIGQNLFPNENLRHGFLVSKSQYLYNKRIILTACENISSHVKINISSLHMWRYQWRDMCYQVWPFKWLNAVNEPKFISIWSKHLQRLLGNIRYSSDIFGNFRKMIENVGMACAVSREQSCQFEYANDNIPLPINALGLTVIGL